MHFSSSAFLLTSHFHFCCDSLKIKCYGLTVSNCKAVMLDLSKCHFSTVGLPLNSLWPSFLLAQTVREQTCMAESYLCVFQAAPEPQSLLRREMSGTAGLSPACGWIYSGMEKKSGSRKQSLMAMEWGSACSLSCSLTSWGGTALMERHGTPHHDFFLFCNCCTGYSDVLTSRLHKIKEGESNSSMHIKNILKV